MRILSHQMDEHTKKVIETNGKMNQLSPKQGNVEQKAAEIQEYMTSILMEKIEKDNENKR
jgi:glycerol kinase